jgi:hypothetical protein
MAAEGERPVKMARIGMMMALSISESRTSNEKLFFAPKHFDRCQRE